MAFKLGVAAVLGFMAVCFYWYLNPHEVPRVLRDNVPGFELRKPASPMNGLRTPRF